MSAPTVFLSAASDDLESLRNVLHGAFSRAGCRVFTQKQSLGSSPGTLREFLVDHINQSDCVIHLAGEAYGAEAHDAFPDSSGFQCSWTQFEYYYAHQQGKKVIAFATGQDLTCLGFAEKGDNAADIERKKRLQKAHYDRVLSGEFTDTPFAGKVKRTLNERVRSMEELLQAVAASVASVHGFADVGEITVQPSLHQLPPNPLDQGFVGREADLQKLRAMPTSSTVLTGLRGMGGIGKTALGLVLAHEWAARFSDAQLFLDGRGTHAASASAEALLLQVIHAFRPTSKLPADLNAARSIYGEVLQGKRVLIFLDNAKDVAQARPLIPPAGCGLIVTSRNSILLGTAKPHDVGRLPDAEAIALLQEYHPALTDTEATTLVRLCAGLPLALRLAGAHLALEGDAPDVAAYIHALGSGRLKNLDAEAEEAGEITISETLRLSEEQLTEAQRTAWRALSVFTASFEARATEVIAAADAITLTTLLRRSMLEREGTDRYKLHDLAADYARDKLSTVARHELALAHARHYTSVGVQADTLYIKGEPVSGLALLDRERAQIEAAYVWLDGQRDEAAAHQLIALVEVITYIGDLRFHPRQRIAWFESQLRAAHITKNRGNEGAALGNLGNAYADLGDAHKAISFYEQALVISRETRNRRVEGSVLGNLGLVHYSLGAVRQAIKYHEQQLVITREISDRRGKGHSLGNLGLAHAALGELRKAIEFYKQALTIGREIGDRRGEGTALGNLGGTHAALGEMHQAMEFINQQMVIVREIGDQRGEGNARFTSALMLDRLGNRPEAIACAATALLIYDVIEDPNAVKVRAKLAEWRDENPIRTTMTGTSEA